MSGTCFKVIFKHRRTIFSFAMEMLLGAVFLDFSLLVSITLFVLF